MTDHPKAKLAFMTQPSPGMFILNLDLGDELSRVELSREQLSNIVADGAGMIFYTRIQPAETRR
jgi:hypothetical protein